MQFSRGSIKALGAISGCLNKAIVAREALPVSCLPACASPSSSLGPLCDFTCEFNLPFSRPVPETSVKRGGRRRGQRGLSAPAGQASGFIKSIVPVGVARHRGEEGGKKGGLCEGMDFGARNKPPSRADGRVRAGLDALSRWQAGNFFCLPRC